MREIIENFINNEDRTDIPLQVHPLYVYFKILEDNGRSRRKCIWI